MLIHLTLPCGNRDFHLLLSFLMYDDFSAFDAEELSIDDGISDFAPGRLDDSPECLARDRHPQSSGLLVEPLQVGKANGFRLVQGEDHFLKSASRHTGRLESASRHAASDPTLVQRTRHPNFPSILMIRQYDMSI